MTRAKEVPEADAVGIIVLSKDGNLFTNQAGGYACRHPEARGHLSDIEASPQVLEALDHVLFNWFSRRHCSGEPLDKLDIALVESVLRSIPIYGKIEVDPSRLSESMEAWVYVKLDGKPCVVFWSNSD